MSSKEIGIEEARKRLGDLITAVQQGADITITRNGKPAARLTHPEDKVMHDDNPVVAISNKRAGTCRYCDTPVAPGAGIAGTCAAWANGAWLVACADHRDQLTADLGTYNTWRVAMFNAGASMNVVDSMTNQYVFGPPIIRKVDATIEEIRRDCPRVEMPALFAGEWYLRLDLPGAYIIVGDRASTARNWGAALRMTADFAAKGDT